MAPGGSRSLIIWGQGSQRCGSGGSRPDSLPGLWGPVAEATSLSVGLGPCTAPWLFPVPAWLLRPGCMRPRLPWTHRGNRLSFVEVSSKPKGFLIKTQKSMCVIKSPEVTELWVRSWLARPVLRCPLRWDGRGLLQPCDPGPAGPVSGEPPGHLQGRWSPVLPQLLARTGGAGRLRGCPCVLVSTFTQTKAGSWGPGAGPQDLFLPGVCLGWRGGETLYH